MKQVIAAAAVVLVAFGLCGQAQAHERGSDRRDGQDRGWRDSSPYARDHGRDYARREGQRYWRDRHSWHGREYARDRDDGRWAVPWYRWDGDRYPRYDYPRYYDPRPYYRYGSRYGDYDDDDDGDFSLLLSLPLRF